MNKGNEGCDGGAGAIYHRRMFIELNETPAEATDQRVVLINIHHIVKVTPRTTTQCAIQMNDDKTYTFFNNYAEVKAAIGAALGTRMTPNAPRSV